MCISPLGMERETGKKIVIPMKRKSSFYGGFTIHEDLEDLDSMIEIPFGSVFVPS